MTTDAPTKPTAEEVAANVAKMRAEASAFEAHARRHDAEATKALAEAQAFVATTRQLVSVAAAAEMALVQAEEKERARLNSDEHHHVYQFDGSVSDGSVGACMKQLRIWDRQDPECDIEVIFNSPGGAVIAGMALFDLIVRMSKRGKGSRTMTVGAQGYAASMGGILLQSGDVRWIGRQSFLMIHEISAGTSGKIGEMQDSVKFYDAICEQVVDLFVERAGGKITRKKFVESWKRIDWWLLSTEALKLGFVDEVR